MKVCWGTVIGLLALLGGTGAGPVRADVFRDVGLGLGYAGFNIEGNRNILSGGYDFLINRNFIGNPLDAGTTDLTLSGPISLSVSTGTRFVDTFDVSLRTALNANTDVFPVSYVLNSDVGGQSTQVSGTLFIDANLSVNGFGFYDLDLTYSSRQDVEDRGRYSNRTDEYDFDLGPITVSGNIFADVLAMVTTPIFEGTGRVNPFGSFSGSAKLNELMLGMDGDALRQLASEGARLDNSLFAPLSTRILAAPNGQTDQLWGVNEKGRTPGSGAAVPEPTVLLLILLGAPFVFGKALRRR